MVNIRGIIGGGQSEPESDQFDRLIENVAVEPKKKVRVRRRKQQITKNFFFLKYILLFIGLGATYMSIYYSFLWFFDFLNIFYSFLLSTIMVSFAVCSFELIIIFKRMKNYIISGVFVFLWILVTSFSMVSTIAGQYNARIPEIKKRYGIINEKINKDYKVKAQESLRKSYERIVENLYKELSMNDKLLVNFELKEDDSTSKKRYDSIVWRSNNVRRKIKRYSKRIELSYKKAAKATKTIVQADDFYVWVSRFLNVSPDWIQFLLSIFPALFIDLIAPFSFAIVIFLFDKR